MAIAVDRHAVSLAVPSADRRLEVIDVVLHVDLRHDPVGHGIEQAPARRVAFERRPIAKTSKSTVPVAIACWRRGL
jgi:hypothetical protein